MTADWFADSIRLKINDTTTYPLDYYEPEFHVPDDHGTAHLSLFAPNGDAVAITSTINTRYALSSYLHWDICYYAMHKI